MLPYGKTTTSTSKSTTMYFFKNRHGSCSLYSKGKIKKRETMALTWFDKSVASCTGGLLDSFPILFLQCDDIFNSLNFMVVFLSIHSSASSSHVVPGMVPLYGSTTSGGYHTRYLVPGTIPGTWYQVPVVSSTSRYYSGT